MLAIGILVLGTFSRLFWHIPDFTPVLALALFGGAYLRKKEALILPVLLLGVTDVILGLHSTMIFTWGSVVLITLVGFWLKSKKTPTCILAGSILSAVIFFVITNLGVWIVGGIYERTFSGLVECFVMALPFFHWSLISTLLYAVILFYGYEFCAVRLKKTQFATLVN
jgi:hypothetical protein